MLRPVKSRTERRERPGGSTFYVEVGSLCWRFRESYEGNSRAGGVRGERYHSDLSAALAEEDDGIDGSGHFVHFRGRLGLSDGVTDEFAAQVLKIPTVDQQGNVLGVVNGHL